MKPPVMWGIMLPRLEARGEVSTPMLYLTPVFGTGMAIFLLGEIFAWFHGIGILLIFAGVYLATVAKTRDRQ